MILGQSLKSLDYSLSSGCFRHRRYRTPTILERGQRTTTPRRRQPVPSGDHPRTRPCDPCAGPMAVRVPSVNSGTPRAGANFAPSAVIPEVVVLLDLSEVAICVDEGEGNVAPSLDLQHLGVRGYHPRSRRTPRRIEQPAAVAVRPASPFACWGYRPGFYVRRQTPCRGATFGGIYIRTAESCTALSPLK
jgi:hypothetical protein